MLRARWPTTPPAQRPHRLDRIVLHLVGKPDYGLGLRPLAIAHEDSGMPTVTVAKDGLQSSLKYLPSCFHGLTVAPLIAVISLASAL